MSFLLVDDDDTANFISKKIIERTFNNPKIRVAKNKSQTLKSILDINKIPIKTIFLDINLGTETGWEVLEEINCLKKNNTIKELPNVVVLSSSIYEGDMQKAKEYKNVLSYVTKPLSVDKLNAIKTLLN